MYYNRGLILQGRAPHGPALTSLRSCSGRALALVLPLIVAVATYSTWPRPLPLHGMHGRCTARMLRVGAPAKRLIRHRRCL